MEIDVKSLHNVLMMAILMALIGVVLSLGGVEDAAKAGRAGSRAKAPKNGATPVKTKKK